MSRITLAEFLGWEEDTEYEYEGMVYKVIDADLIVNVDGLYQWERVNEGDIKIHELGKLSEEAERVEPKKYYLKHKFLIGADVGDMNSSVCSKEWFFDSKSDLCYVQKRFTEEEIKELENDGWVLENYRKIEVEDE